MMKCIIIDDEPLARAGMELHIKQVPQLELVGNFSNPLDAIELIQTNAVELMFLDINMPEINGLDFMKSLAQSPMVIFATAYPQYAADSYEFNAIDYLLKPIRFERFFKAVNKALNYKTLLISQNWDANKVESVSEDFIYIKADRKYFKILFKDICYIEGLKDYVIIHLRDRRIITAMNLKTIFEQLPQKLFARISKFSIVNILHIVSFDTYTIFLNNTELIIGQGYKDNFFKDFVDNKTIKR
jgi:DNA-binding LytR/AlgR family response regulator